MTSCQRIFRIFLKHLLINVCNFLIGSFVDLQVSEPYRRADVAFVLKILSFVCNLIHFSFHTGINIENLSIALSLSRLAVMSSSVPAPVSSFHDAFQRRERTRTLFQPQLPREVPMVLVASRQFISPLLSGY